jgi:UDP-glucose 4-epimerase
MPGGGLVRVFITGIAGFLGGHLARCSLEAGHEVAGVDSMLAGHVRNVPCGARWREAECQRTALYQHLVSDADVVVHTAAAPYEGLSVFSPQVVCEHTFMSTAGALRAAITAGASRFVFCSSMSRYGSQPAPFTEDMPVAPADPYAVAKTASEDLVRVLCGLHGMEYVIVVPHNIYGPGQCYTDPFRNVAAIMVNRILQGRPPVIYGDGSQRRSLSYISDVTGPLMQALTAPVAGEVINVGPDDTGVTISELAGMILKLTDCDLEPVHFPPRPAEVHTATCSAAKARRLLGYEPRVPLEDGLRELIAWVAGMGPRPFDYHLPVELPSERTPATWTRRLI